MPLKSNVKEFTEKAEQRAAVVPTTPEVQAVGPQRQQGFAVGLRVAPILLERFVHDVSVG